MQIMPFTQADVDPFGDPDLRREGTVAPRRFPAAEGPSAALGSRLSLLKSRLTASRRHVAMSCVMCHVVMWYVVIMCHVVMWVRNPMSSKLVSWILGPWIPGSL